MTSFIRVASLDQIPPGKILAVEAEGVPIALYNVGGTIHATRDCCTHQSYPLSKGALRGKYVTCAFHHWVYDVTNGESQGNPDVHVACFDVKIEGNEVLVLPVPRPLPPRPFISRDDA